MNPMRPDLSERVAARYKEKKVSDEGNTIYLYSERQVAHRHRQKAERIEKLKSKLSKLRTQVKKDLTSDDKKTRMTALAVALIDHTYERVGNDESADDGHYGVTGWQKNHISFSGSSATIKYVGKAGVKHEKKVTDGSILKALRQAHKETEGKEACLFKCEGATVGAKDVNAYLKDFDITAKDLRGLHANQEMQDRLKAIRSKGGKLPEEKKEREKVLKAEFKEALEGAAEAVGHEAATLRSQYLVPGLEEAYLHDGSIIKKFTERKSFGDDLPPLVFANRVIRQLVDHMLGEDMTVSDEDFGTMRLTFRHMGGTWERVWGGDMDENERLKNVVVAWGQMPGRKREGGGSHA
jgi:DNA topoisomerase IB